MFSKIPKVLYQPNALTHCFSENNICIFYLYVDTFTPLICILKVPSALQY